MLFPSMDNSHNKKRILYAMLDTLMSENDLTNGAIMLKVKFTEPVESDKETFIS